MDENKTFLKMIKLHKSILIYAFLINFIIMSIFLYFLIIVIDMDNIILFKHVTSISIVISLITTFHLALLLSRHNKIIKLIDDIDTTSGQDKILNMFKLMFYLDINMPIYKKFIKEENE